MNVENHTMPAGATAAADDAPWRAAPLDADRLAAHGRQLAAGHRLHAGRAADSVRGLSTLLAANAEAIAGACDALDRARHAGFALPLAGERLLDGHHLLESQIRLGRGQLGRIDAALPTLAPDRTVRAWRLVLDAVARGDGRIDAPALAQFLHAYQQNAEHASLQIAELDALPALLRLALIDNLRRLATRAARAGAGRERAAAWAARFIETADTRPGDLVLLVADMARGEDTGNRGFVAELARRLEGRGAAVAQVLEWIDARLVDAGDSIAQQLQRERVEEADDAVSVGNSLASLRLLGATDWRVFAEELGTADALLRQDPDGSYARMDGATRDRYRHAVAQLARTSGIAEAAVAQEALALAGVNRAPGEGGLDARTRHIGHYLLGPGCGALQERLRGARRRAPRLAAVAAVTQRAPLAMRIGAMALLALAFTAALMVHARQGGAGLVLVALVGMLALPGASQLARTLVRMTTRQLAAPAATPRMDAASATFAAAPTLVAVAAQAQHEADIDALCDGLEQRYLGNRDAHLRFCLLLDLPDAASEAMPADAALLAHAHARIDALNATYGANDEAASGPFLLLVRPRSWSVSEQAWIGRERRRGQMMDLNAWLCGARERFMLAAGHTGAAAEVRYVIALDADTGLPPDAARSLAAAMAHPLHQPVQDDSGRVREGHGMLLPELAAGLPAVTPALARYARLRPDAARGWAAIIDVDAWHRALGDAVGDEGRAMPGLVEEDLLRAGRVPDLRLDLAHPASYGEHVLQRHRRLRAAWQEARRLGRNTGHIGNIIRVQARWRLFDTLRASLVAPATVALLVLCWSMLAAPVFWTAAALAVYFLPALLGSLLALADRPHDAPWRQHLDGWGRAARAPLVRAALSVAFLPHAAWADADALARGLWRRDVTRRRLLELRPDVLARPSSRMDSNWRSMWFAPLLAVLTAVLLTFANPYALFAIAPLLLVWFLSPVLAWWTSQPSRRNVRLAPAQTRHLEALARRSWAFFEQHGAAAHGLAPNTVLEHAVDENEASVGPSGMGLSLLATLAAHDFGYLPLGALIERSERALGAMALLERWNGHLFAGYDSATLAPIEPARVDSAASGSLVLALRTFAAGLDELAQQPIAGRSALAGVRATVLVVRQHLAQAAPAVGQALDAVDGALARCRAVDTLPGLTDCLRTLASSAAELAASLPDDADPVLRAWCARLSSQCEAQLHDLCAQAPWMRAVQEYVFDASLTRIPTLRELATLSLPSAPESGAEGSDCAAGLAALVDEGRACAQARLDRIAALTAQARALARMDFSALVDPDTGLLASGIDVREERLDSDSCDLLASESRMASYAAVAQGQLPQQHWWALGRPQRMAGRGEGGAALLLSRHGALADYLAPRLIMPGWRDTLLEGAAHALVRAQALHARAQGRLWGFSRAGCNAVDAAARYREGAFGLAAAALQRRAPDDLVAAPHAAALALAVAPSLAAANLRKMAEQGLLGEVGLYEALDYAPARLPQGERQVVVRAYAAPHQAATLLALAAHLLGEPMQRRFCRDPELRAALGLLQEPQPARGAEPALRYGGGTAGTGAEPAAHPYARVITPNSGPLPDVQLLSNGRYHVVQDSSGGAVSRWEDHLITQGGLALWVRDAASGQAWPNTSLAGPGIDAVFAEGRATFRRFDDGIALVTDVVVAPLHDVELRRVRIVNRGLDARTLELTSCVALAASGPDEGGRSNVKMEFDAAADSLLCVTAPDAPVVVHRMTLRGMPGAPSVETSGARFVGRGHHAAMPQAVSLGGTLPGLDTEPDLPLLALRRTVTLAPQQELTLDLILGAASSRAVARELAAHYGAPRAGHKVDHAFEAAWTQGQALLRRAGVGEADVGLYNRLAGCLLQPVAGLRADPAIIARNARGRADLAPYGVGALPLLLLELGPDAHAEASSSLARQVLQAHAYWQSRGFAADLLVLCDGRATREALMHLAASTLDPDSFDRPGGVHLQLRDEVPQEDRILLGAVAHVRLTSERGDLDDGLRRAARQAPALPARFAGNQDAPAWQAGDRAQPQPELMLDNDIGGFTLDGREYVVRTGPGLPVPPAPWVNLLANAAFGSVVSERGHAVSWSGTRDVRLSAGMDDGVAPDDGEAFYLRDDDSGAVWSPTPWPAPAPASVTETGLVRHGFGYSVFEQRAHGIHSTLRCFVAQDAPLKYSVLTLRNDSDMPRHLSVTGYVPWLLDDVAGADPGMQVVTGTDLASGALLASNAFGEALRGRAGFFHVDAEAVIYTCDRDEFIGRDGSIARPAALARAGLSGACGAGMAPCAALQAQLMLAPGAEHELVFVLGVAGAGSFDASRMVQRHGGARAAAAAWQRLRDWWETTLGAVQVRTPDPAFDLRINGWLPYQAISAMLGERCPAARLQSALATVHARPELLREALLGAARDFAIAQESGQPPAVDDFLWLPFALTRYLAASGDHAVLGALPLRDDGRDSAGLAVQDDLYAFCVHGLRGCLRFGPRGLPLAAARLHEEGAARVESVRLGFFMTAVLQRFADVADRRGDFGFATTCRGAALALAAQCEEHGWDGQWYRWTWLDSSTAVGASANAACRAELSTQAWAVLAGAARGVEALQAVMGRLHDTAHGALAMCDPPVDGHWRERVAASPGQDHRAVAWALMAAAGSDAAVPWALAHLLDPIARTATLDACMRYAAPPYFMTDGLRTIAPHAGRAFGDGSSVSAAWTWNALVGGLLGVERDGACLRLSPRLAPGWQGFALDYRYRGAIYAITVQATDGAQGLLFDGQPCSGWTIDLLDDRRDHRIDLRLTRPPAKG